MEERDREMRDALGKAGCAPLLVNIIAKRVRQIQRGARTLIDEPVAVSTTDIAVKEFLEDKIGYRKRD